MSEAATQERAVKQRWAVPGSAHDSLVRWSKVVLPMRGRRADRGADGGAARQQGDVSFILDKKKVENAPERMRVEAARYNGADDKGQKFEIVAKSAIQQSSDVPIVDIRGMFARLALSQGPLLIAANQGRYDLDAQKVDVNGPVRVVGPDGYRLETRDVEVDLKRRQVTSSGKVTGSTRLGPFQAGGLKADLGSRTVVLDGGARLKIVQGTVR